MKTLAKVWVSEPVCCGHERAVPITHLSCDSIGSREMLYHFTSMPEAGGRADSKGIRVGGLSLTLISCCIWESGPYARELVG